MCSYICDKKRHGRGNGEGDDRLLIEKEVVCDIARERTINIQTHCFVKAPSALSAQNEHALRSAARARQLLSTLWCNPEVPHPNQSISPPPQDHSSCHPNEPHYYQIPSPRRRHRRRTDGREQLQAHSLCDLTLLLAPAESSVQQPTNEQPLPASITRNGEKQRFSCHRAGAVEGEGGL